MSIIKGSNTLPVAIMAAGSARRFGSDKRFYPLQNGQSILQTTLSNMARVHPENSLHLVVSHSDALPIFTDVLPAESSLIVSSHSHEGLGGSLKDLMCYLLDKDQYSEVTAIGVYLADMPAISPDTMAMLRGRASTNKIVRPVYGNTLGHPVWIGREFWPLFYDLTGDNGGREILKKLTLQTECIEVEDAGVVMDFDTPKSVIRWQEHFR
ncbi:nucleotidyltransferase family protein [Marinomonas sp.]|nr:nucleotidyltransferase family protein [Marinomonas sp.]MDB4836983.1 nucleotidyltransferase family protein [Marinomonas sp.]